MQTNNKCKIKSQRTILFLWMVLLFVGCSKEDLDTNNETTGNAIAFDCLTSTLRTTETTTDNMQYFRVSAVWDKGAGSYEPFMSNQLVEKQNNNWIYSPLKYWPKDGTVNFFAYSPATSAGLESFQINNTNNQVSIGYTVSDNYQKQEDFIVATSLEQEVSPIQLNFKHVLSMVKFKARSVDVGAEFRIRMLMLTNLYGEGILTGTPAGVISTWAWSSFSQPKDYEVYQKYPFVTDGNIYQDVGDLMVIPQIPRVLSDATQIATIRIIYENADGTGDYPIEFDYSNGFVFEMNKRYTFYFDLTGSSSFIRSSTQDSCTPEVSYYVKSEPIE